jgi:hypothetical protein
MNLSLFRGRRFVAAAMTAGVAAVGLLSAGCTVTPANTSSKIISGTIQGADGHYVDAFIGFEVRDAANHHIDLGGGNTGYSVIQRVNYCLGASGSAAAQTCYTNGTATGTTTKNWSLRIPANAVSVWIEVYPKDASPSGWINNYQGYTGPSTGHTDLSTYATSERASIPMTGSRSGISIVMPKVCAAGGTTGSIAGHIANWPVGHTGSANAWSLASNNLPDMGFATGTVDASGNYKIPNLQSGQRYGILASGGGKSWNMVDYRRQTSNDTLVNKCSQTTFNF